MWNVVRTLVSGSRNRFRDDEFDLDLAYITPQVVAMGFPADGIESYYRNHADEVLRMLTKYHGDQFMVYNLSWLPYTIGESLFLGRVKAVGCLDHHAMPLEPFVQTLLDMHRWLQGAINPTHDRVVAVHCLAGKGRTGMLISGYLALCWANDHGVPDDILVHRVPARSDSMQIDYLTSAALSFFTDKRGCSVENASQRRYVKYVCQCALAGVKDPSMDLAHPTSQLQPMLRIKMPVPARRFLHRITLSRPPRFEGGFVPVVHILRLPWEHGGDRGARDMPADGVGTGELLIYNTAWAANGGKDLPIHVETEPSSDVSITVGQELCGDVLVRVLHHQDTLVFRFAFHTSFVEPTGATRFATYDLDDVDKHAVRTPFTCSLYFDDSQPSGLETAAGVCVDGGNNIANPCSMRSLAGDSDHSDCNHTVYDLSNAVDKADPGNNDHPAVLAGDGSRQAIQSVNGISRVGYLQIQEVATLISHSYWRKVWCVLQFSNLSVYTHKSDSRAEFRLDMDGAAVEFDRSGSYFIICVPGARSDISLQVARSSDGAEQDYDHDWREKCSSEVALTRWFDALLKAGAKPKSALDVKGGT